MDLGLLGSTGMCSLEITRTSKGDYTYSLKTYFTAKGRGPEAAIDRADKLRLEVEKRLGLIAEPEPAEPAAKERGATWQAMALVTSQLVCLGKQDLAEAVKMAFIDEDTPQVEALEKETEEKQAEKQGKKSLPKRAKKEEETTPGDKE